MHLNDVLTLFKISDVSEITKEQLKEAKRVAQRTHPDFQQSTSKLIDQNSVFQHYQRAYGYLEREFYRIQREQECIANSKLPVMDTVYEPITEINAPYHNEETQQKVQEIYGTKEGRLAANKLVNQLFEERQMSAKSQIIKNWWDVKRTETNNSDPPADIYDYNPNVSINKIDGLSTANINDKMEELRRTRSQHLIVRTGPPRPADQVSLGTHYSAVFDNGQSDENDGAPSFSKGSPLVSALQGQDVRSAYGGFISSLTLDETVRPMTIEELEEQRAAFIAPISEAEGLRRFQAEEAERMARFEARRRDAEFSTAQHVEHTQKAMGAFFQRLSW